MVLLSIYIYRLTGVKIAVGYRILPTELIKSPVSYIDKFSEMSDSKKKIKSLK